MSELQRQLHAEHKRRMAAFGAAACRHSIALPPLIPEPVGPQPVACLPPEPIKHESWNWPIKELPKIVNIQVIQSAVATHYNLQRSDLCSATRTANVVRPRQIAMYLARKLIVKSVPEIGRRFGGRDHTTVLHAENRIKALIGTDPKIAASVAALEAELTSIRPDDSDPCQALETAGPP